MTHHVKGFTLLELMIAVSLGVILLGIGAPALSSLLNENTLQFESRSLLKHLRYARSQAVDNQVSVTACLSDASDNCVAGSPAYLLVFIDNNSNNILNNGEQLLARTAVFPSSLTASNTQTSSIFRPDGTRNFSVGSNGVEGNGDDTDPDHIISLCSSGYAQIDLLIPPSGRIRQATQANICP